MYILIPTSRYKFVIIILPHADNRSFCIPLLNMHSHFCHFKLMALPKGIRFETIVKTKDEKELHGEGLKFGQK